MTAKIFKSELAGVSAEDFDLVVQAHARDLRDHDAHHTRLAAGATDHVPYPPPSSLAVVDRAVRRPDFVVDYEIIDDTPPPPTAEVRLAALRLAKRSEVVALEVAAQNAVIAPGKVRAFLIRQQDILAKPETERTREDRDFLRDQNDRAARLEAIHRHGAQLEAELEDLDEEALTTWQPRPFPG